MTTIVIDIANGIVYSDSRTSFNGKVVFGSGFDHARFAIDVCDESPSTAIRSAAEHDQYTNNNVQKIDAISH